MESNWMRPKSKGEIKMVSYRKVTCSARFIYIILYVASIICEQL